MSDNIIQIGGVTAVINGGEPMPGCPQSWDEAHKWEDSANGDKEDFEFPKWKWDCGFKLDYDGPLVSVSSRFYPPKSHYGPTWDGTVHIKVFNEKVATKAFDCQTLDELRAQVESYINETKEAILKCLSHTAAAQNREG